MTLVLLAGLSAGVLQDTHGNVVPNRQVYVYSRGTTTPVQVYSDAAGASAVTQPLTTDTSGQVPGYVAGGASIDIVDALTGLREQAEPVVAGDLASVLSFGAKGDGVTDDTTAVQNALNAVSTAGGGTVVFPSGKTFMLGTITPPNNVTVWAYGATLKLKPAATAAMFNCVSGALSSFSLFGGTFPGTGAETTNQSVVRIENPGTATDITIRGTTVTNWHTSPFFLANVTRQKILNNTLVSCGVGAAFNVIDLVDRSTTGTYEAIVHGNILEGCNVGGIAYVNTGNTTDADKIIVITGNTITTTSTSNSCIDIECATASIGANSVLVIANNLCVLSTTSTGFFGIDVLGSTNTVKNFAVTGNVVKCTTAQARGIRVSGSSGSVTGNHVTQIGAGLFAFYAGSTRTAALTGDVANLSSSIANVTGSQTGVVNGAIVTGTGIPAGTWITAGAGTATWTLSQAATGGSAGEAITVDILYTGLNITGNTIETGADPSNLVFQAQRLAYSRIAQNLISVTAGSSTSTNATLRADDCAWCEITDNTLEYAPHHALLVSNSHNLTVERNAVHNPGEAGQSGAAGIFWQNQSGGGLNLIRANKIVDDRAAAKLVNAITLSSATGVDVLDNILLGWTTAPVSGTAASKRDNVYKASSATSGRATLATGTVTVSTTEIQTGDNVILTRVVAGGTVGVPQVGTIVAGTSFVINSVQPGTASTVQAADTSVIYWRIDH